MTLQPHPEPLTYTDGGAYVPADSYAPRPTSVTVIAIVGIVLGALGLLCRPLSLVMFVVKMPVENPVIEAMKNDSFIRGWMVIGVATEWLISLLLVLSSVGSLRLRDWGRQGMLAYAPLKLLITIVGQVIGILAINPTLAPAMKQAAAQQPSAFQMSPTTSIVLVILWSVWLPLWILWTYTRPAVKAAFQQGLPPPGATI
jgi:hypothetical protein